MYILPGIDQLSQLAFHLSINPVYSQ